MCLRILSLLLLGTLITGCASDPGPKPEKEQEAAYSAVRAADDAGATDIEPALMTSAREHLEAAQQLIKEEQYPEARRELEKATIDARLAESRALTQQVRNELGDVRTSIDSLRRSLEAEQ